MIVCTLHRFAEMQVKRSHHWIPSLDPMRGRDTLITHNQASLCKLTDVSNKTEKDIWKNAASFIREQKGLQKHW